MNWADHPSFRQSLSSAERARIQAGFDRLSDELRRQMRFGGRDAAQQAELLDLSRECDKRIARLGRRLAALRQSALPRANAPEAIAIIGDLGPEERLLVEERDRNRRLGLSVFLSSRGNPT